MHALSSPPRSLRQAKALPVPVQAVNSHRFNNQEREDNAIKPHFDQEVRKRSCHCRTGCGEAWRAKTGACPRNLNPYCLIGGGGLLSRFAAFSCGIARPLLDCSVAQFHGSWGLVVISAKQPNHPTTDARDGIKMSAQDCMRPASFVLVFALVCTSRKHGSTLRLQEPYDISEINPSKL